MSKQFTGLSLGLPLDDHSPCPPTGLKPHTDVLKEFPYLGTFEKYGA
jgi:hypothetical protein